MSRVLSCERASLEAAGWEMETGSVCAWTCNLLGVSAENWTGTEAVGDLWMWVFQNPGERELCDWPY